MILYHIVTTDQLLHCILNKELFHKEQICYMILPDFINEKYPQFKRMEGLFFDKIFVFKTSVVVKELDSNITNEVVDNFLGENKIKIDEFTEIVLENPKSYFGRYLVRNRIDFTFLGEKRKFINISEAIESIGKLDSSFIDRVLASYGIDQKIKIIRDSIVLLAQDFSNLGKMSFEKHRKIYQLVVDYFLQESNLVINSHPDDLMFYDILFPQSTVIRGEFPYELIPFIFTEKPQTVMTITALNNNLKSYFKHHIHLNKRFSITHDYYCIIKIINELKGYEIYELNSDKLLLDNLLNMMEGTSGRNITSINSLSRISGKSIVIIDDFDCNTTLLSQEISDFLKQTDIDPIIIFPNSNKEYMFYDYPNKLIFESLVPVEILQNSTVDETEQYSNTFFVYSKRRDIRNMINELTYEKLLRRSKEIIKVESLSEEQLRIKILEGILEATEKRLEHYVQIVSELEKIDKDNVNE